MRLFGLFGAPDVKRLAQKRDINGLVKALRYKDTKVQKDSALALEHLEWQPPTPEAKATFLFAAEKWSELSLLGPIAAECILPGIRDKRTQDKAKQGLVSLGTSAVQATVKAFISEGKSYADEDIGFAMIARLTVVDGKQEVRYTAGRIVAPTTKKNEDPRWALLDVLRSLGTPAIAALVEERGRHDRAVSKNLEWALAEMGKNVAPALVPQLLLPSGKLDANAVGILAHVFGESEAEDLAGLFRKVAAAFPELVPQLSEQKLLPSESPIPVTGQPSKAKKTVVTVLREFLIECEAETSKLSGSSGLELIDLLRNIVNSNFAEEDLRKALTHPNTKIQALVKRFLARIEQET